MKKGEEVDSSEPLAALSQKIIEDTPKKVEINQRHKLALKNQIMDELEAKKKIPYPGFFNIIFSLRPQNLVAYGSLVVLVCFVLLVGNLALPGERPPLVETAKEELARKEELQEAAIPPAATSEEVFDESAIAEELEEPEEQKRGNTRTIIFSAGIGAGIIISGTGIRLWLKYKNKDKNL